MFGPKSALLTASLVVAPLAHAEQAVTRVGDLQPAAVAPAQSDCSLYRPEALSLLGSECTKCHPMHRSHPVDLDYAFIAMNRPSDLRAPADVVKRGLLLPDGQVRCATCHDVRSPWKYKIALPPASPAMPAVDPGIPSTYDPEARNVASTALPLPPGSAVSPKPLCLACHALD